MGALCFLLDGTFEFDGRVVRGYEALREYGEAHTRAMRSYKWARRSRARNADPVHQQAFMNLDLGRF